VNYASCDPDWRGETVFIICGGPSLRSFDFERLRGRRVLVVNSSLYAVPWADALFFGDDRWGFQNMAAINAFAGEIYTVSTVPVKTAKRLKKVVPPPALIERPNALVMRRTSLTASLNLAWHKGVARIVVLGADMKAAADGRTHHHAPHPWPSLAGCWDEQMKELRGAATVLTAAGIEVVNASLESRIDFWPKQDIGELL
jgi:hypothetical protein